MSSNGRNEHTFVTKRSFDTEMGYAKYRRNSLGTEWETLWCNKNLSTCIMEGQFGHIIIPYLYAYHEGIHVGISVSRTYITEVWNSRRKLN